MEDSNININIRDFIGHFGDRSRPNGYVGSSRIYSPGYQKFSQFHIGRYSVKAFDYTVDYINGNLELMSYWQQAQKDVGEHIYKVVYKIIYKIGSIKKILERIEKEQHAVHQILINAEKELKYLKFVYQDLETGNKKYGDLSAKVLAKFNEHNVFYENLLDYYFQLPGIKMKYERLMEAVKTRKKCFTCFRGGEIGNLVVKKKKVWCKKCLARDERGAPKIGEEECDCPVCLEPFKKKQMVETACGGDHWICSPCMVILKRYRSDCPMCRGILV